MTAVPADHPLITAARQWYDAGYCVVPSHEDGTKRPWGKWKQYQSTRMEWDQLQAMLLMGSFTGIGAIMGKASKDTELLEIEGPTEQAAANIGRLLATADQMGCRDLLNRVLSGCVIRSAGDGLHLFVRIIDGPAKANTKLAMSRDGEVIAETRGEGGFVIVAPTPGRKGHAEGKVYAFIGPSNPAATALVTVAERDLLHEVFTAALDQTPSVTDQVTLPRTLEPFAGTSALDAFRATSWAAILQPLGWTWDHRDEVRDYWVRPGKSAADGISASTIEDGPMVCFSTNAGLPTDIGLSKGQVYAHLHHGGDMSAASRALSAQGFGDALGIPPLPSWEMELPPEATEEDVAEAKSSWIREHFPLLDWHALWADQTEEEWIVEPLIAKRRLVALYSAPKVGKSLLMLELAASMAAGREVLGVKGIKPIRTLYVDFENDPRGDIRERLRNMGFGPDDLRDLCYLSFPTMAKLDTPAGADQLMDAIEEYGCEVVVIDTVSRAVAGDENENDTWLNFYRHTGLRLKRAEVALIRLDHSGKDESKGQRGGSAKSGDVDAVWRLAKRSDTSFQLVCEANRFPVGEMELNLKRVEDGGRLVHKVDMDARKERLEVALQKLAKAGVPRTTKTKNGEEVPEMSARAARAMLTEAGIKTSSGEISAYVMAEYCRRMPSVDLPELAI